MKVTLLGTGTSQGVPVIACDCEVCQSDNPKDKRLRASILIEKDDTAIVVDTGPDFRQQMLTHKVKKLDAVLFTHEHKDHTAGLDDVRSFNFAQHAPMEIYAEKRVQESIKREFLYAFEQSPYPGVPKLNMNTLENKPFEVGSIQIIPIRVMHHKLPVFGFRIDDFAYITDVKTIPEEEFEKLNNLDTLVLTALRKDPHLSHMNLSEALHIIERLSPPKTYLTHISHTFGFHNEINKELPQGVELGYDGLTLEFDCFKIPH